MAINRLSSIPSTAGNFAGNPIFPGNPIFSGNPSVTGNFTVNGRLDVAEVRENLVDGTVTSNILTANYNTSANWFVTSLGANFTVNVTNAPTDNGKIITVIVIVSQGATAYIPNAFQIEGSAQTLRWIGGVTPTGNINKIDIFTFNLIRRSSAWTVLGNGVLNF